MTAISAFGGPHHQSSSSPCYWGRARAAQFSDKEDEILVSAYAKRKRHLESSAQHGITPATKKALWEEIADEVNSVAQTLRTSDTCKVRWQNMQRDYKKYNQMQKKPPTGGGKAPPVKPFVNELDKYGFADDTRIAGIRGGADICTTQSNSGSGTTLENLVDEDPEILDVDGYDFEHPLMGKENVKPALRTPKPEKRVNNTPTPIIHQKQKGYYSSLEDEVTKKKLGILDEQQTMMYEEHKLKIDLLRQQIVNAEVEYDELQMKMDLLRQQIMNAEKEGQILASRTN